MRVLLIAIVALGVLASCSDQGSPVADVPVSGPPRVLATDPPDGARGPFPHLFAFGDGEDAPHFVVHFSTPVRISSFEPGMVRVAGFPADVLVQAAPPAEAGGDQQDVSATVVFHLLIPNLMFPQWYDVGRNYEVVIDTNVRSAAGVKLSGPHRFSFLPEPSLRVVSFAPEEGGRLAVYPLIITVQFNSVVAANAAERIALTPSIPGAWVSTSFGDMPSSFAFEGSAGIRSGTRYVLRVAAGVQDRYGYLLADGISSGFTTAPFSIGELRPAPGAVGVPVETVISAACGWPADISTLDSGVTITPAISGRWISESNPERIVLLPEDDLDEGVTYTVRISPAVRAIDGTPLPGGMEWHFTTAGQAFSSAAIMPRAR